MNVAVINLEVGILKVVIDVVINLVGILKGIIDIVIDWLIGILKSIVDIIVVVVPQIVIDAALVVIRPTIIVFLVSIVVISIVVIVLLPVSISVTIIAIVSIVAVAARPSGRRLGWWIPRRSSIHCNNLFLSFALERWREIISSNSCKLLLRVVQRMDAAGCG